MAMERILSLIELFHVFCDPEPTTNRSLLFEIATELPDPIVAFGEHIQPDKIRCFFWLDCGICLYQVLEGLFRRVGETEKEQIRLYDEIVPIGVNERETNVLSKNILECRVLRKAVFCKQGIHFPLVCNPYFHAQNLDWILEAVQLAEEEALDCCLFLVDGTFCRLLEIGDFVVDSEGMGCRVALHGFSIVAEIALVQIHPFCEV